MSCSLRPWTLVTGLLCGLAALPADARAGPRSAPLRVRVPDAAGMAVQRALLGARQRLLRPSCGQLLDDFGAMSSPRPLADVLLGLGRTPAQHLDALRFEDGTRKTPCASPQVLAFTHAGSGTVYVCASQFKNAVRNDPAYAEMILIHEWLHTLGLGEDPPTSLEITARVIERCGEAASRRARASG